jgi:hypothetical protein
VDPCPSCSGYTQDLSKCTCEPRYNANKDKLRRVLEENNSRCCDDDEDIAALVDALHAAGFRYVKE